MKAVETYSRHSARQFEMLLRERLCLAAEERPVDRDRRCNFEHLNVPIGESYVDSIVKLFNVLPAPVQERFRVGLVDLLRHASANDFSAQGMADIVYLIGMTQSFRGLEALVDVLDAGGWTRKHPHLVYDALSVLKMFPSSVEAYRATERLATSASFQDDFVFDAYGILLRCRPANWATSLNLLMQRFSRLVQQIEHHGSREQRDLLVVREQKVAKQLRALVPLADIARRLGELDPARPFVPRLVTRLFGGGGPLGLTRDVKGGYQIYDRTDLGRQVKVTLGEPLLVAAMKLKLIAHKVPALRKVRIPMRAHVVAAVLKKLGTLSPNMRDLAAAVETP